MLSIIIPTLNEEEYLPLLLNSVKQQVASNENSVFKDYEIIVADAGSKDKTVEIARKYDCRIVLGGSPARGRNEGAKRAEGDIFLFLDADLRIPKDFLEKSLKEFKRRKLDVASYCLVPQTKKKILKNGFDLFYNQPIKLSQNLLAHGAMGILVKKKIFEKVEGFDEKIKLAEDLYFVRQADKVGKFGIIESTKIYITLRRFETDGYLPTLFKYFLCHLFMLSGKGVRSDVFKYRFGHYSKTERGEDERR